MRGRYPIFGLIVLLGALLVLGTPAFGIKSAIKNSLASIFGVFTPESELRQRISELELENANLRAQITREQVTPEGSGVVYSSYPFNTRSEVAVGIGSGQGVEVGDIVTHGTNILIGRVKEVSSDISIVSTIFDPDFKTAVRIGDGSTDAVMSGGNELTLELIPEDATVELGELVFTASKDFPYALAVGRIREVGSDRGTSLQTAALIPEVDIRSLRNINVLR